MKRKMLFFDIDGTLLEEDTLQIPESTKEALAMAKANGHMIFINTGRTISNIDDNMKALNFDGYVCGCGTYIEVGKEVLLHRTLDEKYGKEIIVKLRECKIDAVLEGFHDLYFDGDNIRTQKMKDLKTYLTTSSHGTGYDWDYEHISFDKFFISCDEQSAIEEFLEFIKPKFDIIDRGNLCWEVVPTGFSKAFGIAYLLNMYHLPLDHAYAFGDSPNDLSMLNYVKNSIAMGNSCDEVKSQVAFVAKDIHEDGIYHAMKHYGLI